MHKGLTACIAAMLAAGAAPAHHSYTMFDLRQPALVEGTVAKQEWRNPHTFLWIYAKKPDQSGEYDLWSFENGPVGIMQRMGWSRNTFQAGEPVVVQYFPARDGRKAGYLVRVVRADGSELPGDLFAPGVEDIVKKGPLGIRPSATGLREAAR